MFKRWRKLDTDSLEKMLYTLELMKLHGIPGYGEKYTKTLDVTSVAPCYIPLSAREQKMSIFCKCTKDQCEFLKEVGLGQYTWTDRMNITRHNFSPWNGIPLDEVRRNIEESQ